MNSPWTRSGMSRLGLLSLLGLPILLAIWLVFYSSVERSARDLIYRKNSPEQAISKLDFWSVWMFRPTAWTWLKAEGYRKLADRSRVSRLVDELTARGVPSIQATSPLLLLESASGVPSKVKDNLGPLLKLYGESGGEVLEALVQGFLNQGDHQSASQALRLWSELYQDDPKASFWKGVYSTVTYDLDSAMNAFKKTIELEPLNARARQELAEVYLEKANFEEASELFEWLLQNRQESPEIITGYARCLLNLGFADQASEQLKKLPDISKLPSPELALVCETNLEADRAQAASDQATILLNRWPDALPYLQLKARSLAKLGQTDQSQTFFTKAAESQNRRLQVDQMIERLATDPNNQELRRDMGEMMMNYLDPAGGIGYIQIASRTNPLDLKTQELLADYYEKEGNLQVAENHRRVIRQIQQAILDSIDATETPVPETAKEAPTLPSPSPSTF